MDIVYQLKMFSPKAFSLFIFRNKAPKNKYLQKICNLNWYFLFNKMTHILSEKETVCSYRQWTKYLFWYHLPLALKIHFLSRYLIENFWSSCPLSNEGNAKLLKVLIKFQHTQKSFFFFFEMQWTMDEIDKKKKNH